MGSETLCVAAYTGGKTTPSARFRVRQYISSLVNYGVSLQEFNTIVGQYPPRSRWHRPAWLALRLAEALARAPGSHRYDLVLFQRELISTLMTVERLYGLPRVLDVDDAIWLHRRGSFAMRLARSCDAVICGNDYLADYFSASRRRVYVLPTGVDTTYFMPRVHAPHNPPVIGWSGSYSNLDSLEAIEPAIVAVLTRFTQARLRVICDRPPRFDHLPASRIEYVRWSPDIEVAALQGLTVGLMPLPDTEWSRGKCAFKMLTYMACGVPVVVSPVGVNTEILAQADIGFGAKTEDEWVDAITVLLEDHTKRIRLGTNARRLAEKKYSVDVLGPELATIFKQTVV